MKLKIYEYVPHKNYTEFRVPCTWNSTFFIIKRYKDGHYYWNRTHIVTMGYNVPKEQFLNPKFTRVKKSWLKELDLL